MFSRGLCQQEHQKNICGIMKGKKNYSSLIEIKSMLQGLQGGLLDKGRDLQKLLEAKYLGADAVLSAVGKIKFRLEDHPVDISDLWVTAHVMVDDKRRFITNRLVREVSILFILLFQLYAICIA